MVESVPSICCSCLSRRFFLFRAFRAAEREREGGREGGRAEGGGKRQGQRGGRGERGV